LLRPKNLRFSSRTNLIKTRCVSYQKKPPAQIAHLVFADTKTNAEKPKEQFSANALENIWKIMATFDLNKSSLKKVK